MASSDRTGNLLLDSVTTDERDELLRRATSSPLRIGEERRRPGERVDEVFFPTSGSLSLIVAEPDGRVEAATIGREGAADVLPALGSRVSAHLLVSQIEGESIDVDLETFNKLYADGPTFRTLIQGWVEALFAQATISAACLALHHLNERCARWLLQSHDRVDSDTFVLKQEFLAMMLGAHRPSVSTAAGTLQASGVIRYSRGKITIVDREGLEDAACACYEKIRYEYSRLVPLR